MGRSQWRSYCRLRAKGERGRANGTSRKSEKYHIVLQINYNIFRAIEAPAYFIPALSNLKGHPE
jgi:hypothetical protein